MLNSGRRPSQMNRGEVTASSMEELVLQVVSIYNPQEDEDCGQGERLIMEWVCRWLKARNIPHESHLSWGVHALLMSAAGPGDKPGVLLSAHLDSDNLERDALDTLRIEDNFLCFEGQVGLDCKTGVAICLCVLDRLRTSRTANDIPWTLHVIFTTGEESGQKGAIRLPISRLLKGRVRHGLVIDRQTRGSGAPMHPDYPCRAVRHAVVSYKGVPLLDPLMGTELLNLLQKAMERAGAPEATLGAMPTVESPNNADALEFRGRWDAEIIAPSLLRINSAEEGSLLDTESSAVVVAALAEYEEATAEVKRRMEFIPPSKRVSGMYQAPRITRYMAMKRMYEALAALPPESAPPDGLRFSCVNLSYDYDDFADRCSIKELELTTRIALAFVETYNGIPTSEKIDKKVGVSPCVGKRQRCVSS